MGKVNCLYCGAKVSDESDRCPECGAPSHFQQRGFGLGGRLRFLFYFFALAVAALVIALILPR